MEGTIFMKSCVYLFCFGLSFQLRNGFLGYASDHRGKVLDICVYYGFKLYWILGAVMGLQRTCYLL